MTWTGDLLTGLAQLLADNGVGTWDPDTLAEEQDRPIGIGPIPEQPDEAVGLTAYNLQADAALADVTQPVQIMLRGSDDITAVDAPADVIFDLLHGAMGLTLGGVRCPLITLWSDVRAGVDESGRHLRSLNYYIQASRPTTSRTD